MKYFEIVDLENYRKRKIKIVMVQEFIKLEKEYDLESWKVFLLQFFFLDF